MRALQIIEMRMNGSTLAVVVTAETVEDYTMVLVPQIYVFFCSGRYTTNSLNDRVHVHQDDR